MFGNNATGELVAIAGRDQRRGVWEHHAFLPAPLPTKAPELSAKTHLELGNARAALAALDSTARRLPNPSLLRRPTLQLEAQSTSALEGTYAPLTDVLTADEDTPSNDSLREVLNYVVMADWAFQWVSEGRPITTTLLCDLQARLVRDTPAEHHTSGRIRDIQVLIGRRNQLGPGDLAIRTARYIPPPPGPVLETAFQQLVDWIRTDLSDELDPIAAAAMAHYQFEALHPFHDGNGRIGRLLIVLQLFAHGILTEPTLTVSPWFEERRVDYYDRLLAVSTDGAWDELIRFFATGIRESAMLTHRQMLALLEVQDDLRRVVHDSRLRADSAFFLVDYAVGHPSFTVRDVEGHLGLSYGRANKLVEQLVALDVLRPVGEKAYNRRFYAPQVMDALLDAQTTTW